MMRGFGQEVKDSPELPDKHTRYLRAKIILEEALEAVEALGFDVLDVGGHYITEDVIRLNPNGQENLANIVKECCDLSVVSIGTLSSCGVNDEPFLEEVDNNNLLKLKNATRRDDGKFVKHPDHPDPDIAGRLNNDGCIHKARPQPS